MLKRTALALLAFAPLLLSGCGKSAPEHRYPLRGEVMALDHKAQSATIKHEKIDGWMEAMTMEFPVKDKAEFDKLAVGERIEATVFVRDLSYYIAGIRVVGKSAPR